MQTQIQTQPGRDAIALRAYRLWEAAGRPIGRDVEHWLQAEAELRMAGRFGPPKFVAPEADAMFTSPLSVAPVRSEIKPLGEPRSRRGRVSR